MKVNTASRIAFGALIHDVGKFVQYAEDIPEDYKNNNKALYQPIHQNQYTHSHALFTAHFLESFQKHIPEAFWQDRDSKDPSAGSLINLAAMHHKPEHPLQWIIAEADRLSSGIDRDEFPEGKPIPPSDAVKTRLIPIFETLFRQDYETASSEHFKWRYRLREISAETIFPIKLNGEQSTKKKEHEEDYKNLYRDFTDKIKALKHKKQPLLWLQHFDSLYRLYTSFIPSARVGRIIHDVSLYDHSRTTAALAVGLFRYHEETNTLKEEAIRNRSEKKFLIVSGDFYGIQNFIFSAGGEERGYRSKILRGRSFTVSLLTELAAKMICDELGLSFLSVFMNAGGKFHLIAHNTEDSLKKLRKIEDKINKWLIDAYLGECAIGITCTEASPEEFLNGSLEKLWDRHLKRMEEKKFNRFDLHLFGGVFKGFLDRFRNDLYRPLCPICGKRPSSESVENDNIIAKPNERASACELCRDHVLIGAKIVRGQRIAIIKDNSEGDLKKPLFGTYQLKFVDADEDTLPEKEIEAFWDVNVRADGSLPTDVTLVPLNGYVPVYEESDLDDDRILAGDRTEETKIELIDMIKKGIPKTFYHIAIKALSWGSDKKELYGIDALGVLKADVDNLGAIFGCGFQGRRFTLSRMATLSRSLNNFFAIYLPYALRRAENRNFRDIYTVFAGGDDLFLIGPWKAIRDASLFIYKKFREYTCHHEKVHLSAGITIHKPSTPVDVIAEKAEESLGEAKGAGRDRITMFDKTVSWNEFEKLTKEIMPKVSNWLEYGLISKSLIYRICDFVQMAENENYYMRIIKEGKSLKMNDIECFKWRAFLRYQIYRNVAKKLPDPRSTQDEIARKLGQWIEEYRGGMIIPLWSLLYEKRKKKG